MSLNKKEQRYKLTSRLLNNLWDIPCAFPAWRCAGFNWRWHVCGATLGRHGEGHLLLFVFGQGSLHCFCMDVCKDKKRNQYTLVLMENRMHNIYTVCDNNI